MHLEEEIRRGGERGEAREGAVAALHALLEEVRAGHNFEAAELHAQLTDVEERLVLEMGVEKKVAEMESQLEGLGVAHARQAAELHAKLGALEVPRQSLGRGRQKSISSQGSGFQKSTTVSRHGSPRLGSPLALWRMRAKLTALKVAACSSLGVGCRV